MSKLIPIIILVLISGFVLFELLSKNVSRDAIDINSVDAIEFFQLAQNEDAFILDVHVPEQEHIPGTDAFIPYSEISENLNRLPEDKSTQVLVYCQSGSMSREAALKLQELGYINVVDLAGGLNAYREVNPSVSISPPQRDLGTVVYGDVARTEFTLTNFTPQKLEITRISTSCGCTSADVEMKSLEPYESTVVKVSFDPAVHKDDTDLGEVIRTIFIETDNRNFEQITANITAEVVRKVGE